MGSSLSSLVFQPPRVTYTQAENSQLFWLHTESATQIPALHIDNGAKLTILFSHGNAEDLGMIYDWMTFFSMELRVNVLAYDYQGYGRAGGSCSERACYEDIDAAYRFLTTQLQIPSANIVLYGRSLGSGPSLYLAEKLGALGERIGGIILQSPLLSVLRVAFPLRYTPFFDMFPNIDRIRKIQAPLLVIHGTRDEVVPFSNGEQLFLAAPIHCRAKPYWIDGGGHNNLETFFRDEALFLEPLRDFLLAHVPAYSEAFFANLQERQTRSGHAGRRKSRRSAAAPTSAAAHEKPSLWASCT